MIIRIISLLQYQGGSILKSFQFAQNGYINRQTIRARLINSKTIKVGEQLSEYGGYDNEITGPHRWFQGID